MNVTKELLESMGVVSMSLSNGREDFLCFLRKTDGKAMDFSILDSKGFSFGEKMELKATLKIGEGVKVCAAEIEMHEAGTDWCSGKIARTSCEEINALFKKFYEMECRDEKYGRRKEMRIPIGKSNYAAFGLSSPEQTLFIKGMKIMRPCAVLDASIHGIQVITQHEGIKTLEDFNIKISFVNPNEIAMLKVHKVHSKLDKAGNKIFATYFCQLLEPIHHVWKERVIRMLESFEH